MAKFMQFKFWCNANALGERSCKKTKMLVKEWCLQWDRFQWPALLNHFSHMETVFVYWSLGCQDTITLEWEVYWVNCTAFVVKQVVICCSSMIIYGWNGACAYILWAIVNCWGEVTVLTVTSSHKVLSGEPWAWSENTWCCYSIQDTGLGHISTRMGGCTEVPWKRERAS